MRWQGWTGGMPVDAGLSASLQSWLGQELESRGIDAVVYTRHILSILQQENPDIEAADNDPFASSPLGRGKKGEKRRSDADLDIEMLKKTAAVKCLLSVTDEDTGIEGLVDELYLKLKKYKDMKDEDETKVVCLDHSDGNDSVLSSSPEDPVERYYAAFPSLSDKDPPKGAAVSSEGGVWAKIAHKISEEGEGSKAPSAEEEGAKTRESEDDAKPTDATFVEKDKAHRGEQRHREIRKRSPKPSSADRLLRQKEKDSAIVRCTEAHGHEAVVEYDQHGFEGKRKSLKDQHTPLFVVPKVQHCGKAVKPPSYEESLGQAEAVTDAKAFDEAEKGRIWLMELMDRCTCERFANRKPFDGTLKKKYKDMFEFEDTDETIYIQGGKNEDIQGSKKEETPEKLLQAEDRDQSFEDLSWYTQPLDVLLPSSPAPPSQRLYKRRSDGPSPLDEQPDEGIEIIVGSPDEEVEHKISPSALGSGASKCEFEGNRSQSSVENIPGNSETNAAIQYQSILLDAIIDQETVENVVGAADAVEWCLEEDGSTSGQDSEINMKHIEALLSELLSPHPWQSLEKTRGGTRESDSSGYTNDNNNTKTCQCASLNDHADLSSLPCVVPFGAAEHSAKSAAMANTNIPASSENEVLDDRPASVDIVAEQLSHTLRFLEECEGCTAVQSNSDFSHTHVHSNINLFEQKRLDPMESTGFIDNGRGSLIWCGDSEWSLPGPLTSQKYLGFYNCDKLPIGNSEVLCETDGPQGLEIYSFGLLGEQVGQIDFTLLDGVPYTFPWSSLEDCLSPKGDASLTSHIWDVNMRKKKKVPTATLR